MNESTTPRLGSLQEKYSSQNKKLGFLIIILLSFNFVLLGINGINTAVDPEGWDTTAYLGEANFIKNQGGVTNFLDLCFTGKYVQANQHPLYILLLTPFASTNISFFINAKIISFIIGLIFLLLLFLVAQKMSGDLPAFVAVFALMLNMIFIEWTTLVACESLLMLFSFLCMYFVIEGFNKNKYWAYAGVFAGLAYLTKGTSLILLPGFGLSALIIYKLKIFKNKYFWSFFALFIIVASPLLIRNTIVYKNPFFNVNNYIITYGIENLKENRYVTFSPDEGATLWKFDESKINTFESKSSGKSSLKIFDTAKKMISGMADEIKPFLNSFNIFQNRLKNIYSWVLGIVLLMFFIIGFSRKKNLGGKIYFISTIFIFLVILSFNPIDRYFLPLVPFIWIYAAFGIFTAWDLANKSIFKKYLRFKLIPYTPHALTLILLIYSIFFLTSKTIANPFNSVEYSESRLNLLNWLRVNLHDNEKYTLGPNFNWQLDRGIWILPPDNAKTKDFSKFNTFIRKHSVSYIILERNSLSDKMKLIENYFLLDPIEGLVEKKSVDGWQLVYKDHKKPVDFLIYKLIK
jgi:hypothetical protein